MILHYNIKPSPKAWHGLRHLAVFYLTECDSSELAKIAKIATETIDSSIGTVYYMDWDFLSGIGTIRIESQMGCEIQALRDACDKILTNIKNN